MINVVGSHELIHGVHVALDPHLLPPPADQGLVLLFVPHGSFLLFANAPFSSRGYAPHMMPPEGGTRHIGWRLIHPTSWKGVRGSPNAGSCMGPGPMVPGPQ